MTLVGAALGTWLLAAAPAPSGRTVQVRILASQHLREIEVAGPAHHRLTVEGAVLRSDGALVTPPLALPAGNWTLKLGSGQTRRYQGSLLAHAVDGELALVLTLPLEAYLAEVVAAETLPGTPEHALRAQAVVARSFLLAQGPRHAGSDVCDLAHCQVLRGSGVPASHRARARAAVQATAGRVLVLASGAVAETPFHASCAGHTADPGDVFGNGVTGAAAVPDSGCPERSWGARIPLATFRRALGPLFRAPGLAGGDLNPASLALVPGAGGYLSRVVERRSGASASGDAVARALDRALGWGKVRSSRFVFRLEREGLRVSGSGIGHGIGLCQAGAARRAAQGESYQAILTAYFPFATLRSAFAAPDLAKGSPGPALSTIEDGDRP